MSKRTFVLVFALVALLLCAFAPAAALDRAVRNVMLADNEPDPNETLPPNGGALPPNQTPEDNYEPTPAPCTPNDITCICDPNTIVCYRVP